MRRRMTKDEYKLYLSLDKSLSKRRQTKFRLRKIHDFPLLYRRSARFSKEVGEGQSEKENRLIPPVSVHLRPLYIEFLYLLAAGRRRNDNVVADLGGIVEYRVQSLIIKVVAVPPVYLCCESGESKSLAKMDCLALPATSALRAVTCSVPTLNNRFIFTGVYRLTTHKYK